MRPYVSEFWRSYSLYKPQPAPLAAETLGELDEAQARFADDEITVLCLAHSTAPRRAIACARLDNLGVPHGC